jgi:hypothetical protein
LLNTKTNLGGEGRGSNEDINPIERNEICQKKFNNKQTYTHVSFAKRWLPISPKVESLVLTTTTKRIISTFVK